MVRNCSSVYASIQDADVPKTTPEDTFEVNDISKTTGAPLRPRSEGSISITPMSLVSQIDGDEYTSFPHCGKGLIAIAAASLDPKKDHFIRIRTSAVGERYLGLRFEGLWLNVGGHLIPSRGTEASARQELISDVAPTLSNHSAQASRQRFVTYTPETISGGSLGDSRSQSPPAAARKVLEIMSDLPRSFPGHPDDEREKAVAGWEELVGDIFGADHVRIGVDGICLSLPCTGGMVEPATSKDVFFRRYASTLQPCLTMADCHLVVVHQVPCRIPDFGTSDHTFQTYWYHQHSPIIAAVADLSRCLSWEARMKNTFESVRPSSKRLCRIFGELSRILTAN